jgi:hypothetical protein
VFGVIAVTISPIVSVTFLCFGAPVQGAWTFGTTTVALTGTFVTGKVVKTKPAVTDRGLRIDQPCAGTDVREQPSPGVSESIRLQARHADPRTTMRYDRAQQPRPAPQLHPPLDHVHDHAAVRYWASWRSVGLRSTVPSELLPGAFTSLQPPTRRAMGRLGVDPGCLGGRSWVDRLGGCRGAARAGQRTGEQRIGHQGHGGQTDPHSFGDVGGEARLVDAA